MRALTLARVLVGSIFLLRTTPALRNLGVAWAPDHWLGWPDGSTWRIGAIALSPFVAALLVGVRTGAAFFFLIGLSPRRSGLVAALVGWTLLAADLAAFVGSLHLLYFATACIAIAGELAPRDGSAVVRALPISVYLFSGLAKLNGSFLSGAVLASLRDQHVFRGAFAHLATASPGRALATSWLVAVGELALGPLLFFARTRRVAVALAIAFHVAAEVTVGPDVFGWVMVACLVGSARTTPATSPPRRGTPSPRSRSPGRT